MRSLGSRLFSEVSPRFFGLLAGENAAVYVTALDALEQEINARVEPLEHEEAVQLVEALVQRGALPVHDEEPKEFEPRERARTIMARLFEAGWMREETQSDWRRLISFDENAGVLLEALRKISEPPGIAVFSDRLVNVCVTLCSDAFADEPWQQLQACRAALEEGLRELRLMGRSIQRHTKSQLESVSLRENLALVFDEFSGKISNACYAELVRARLPARLAAARRAVDRLQSNVEVLDRMQTELMDRQRRSEASQDPATAMARVRNELDAFALQLGRVTPLADEIDRRASEFARKSLARFRYLQEVASHQRETVQTFFESLNTAFAGKSYREMAPLAENLPRLRIPDVRCLSGVDSLYRRRLRARRGEIEPLDDAPDASEEAALHQLQAALRDSLSLGRANRFVAQLPAERLRLEEIPLPTTDELEDLIACFLHVSSRNARYEIELDRIEKERPVPIFREKAAHLLEDFVLIKK